MMAVAPQLIVRHLGLVAYEEAFEAMRRFTARRDGATADEIWLLQHPPTFTQGRNGKAEHLLATGDIPLVQSDRGGQVTYHAPGQLIAYLLLDMKRHQLGVRQLVTMMEQAVISLASQERITAFARPEAPGVYVAGAKLAALGLRVKRGCSYHGISLNVDMDLTPFQRINPCGYPGLEVTSLRQLGSEISLEQAGQRLASLLQEQLALPR